MPSLKHIHSYVKFRRQKSDGQQLWRCEDPICTHFTTQQLVKGKLSNCPNCKQNQLVLEGDALERTRPLCIYCRNTKEAKEYRASLETVTNLFKEETTNDDSSL